MMMLMQASIIESHPPEFSCVGKGVPCSCGMHRHLHEINNNSQSSAQKPLSQRLMQHAGTCKEMGTIKHLYTPFQVVSPSLPSSCVVSIPDFLFSLGFNHHQFGNFGYSGKESLTRPKWLSNECIYMHDLGNRSEIIPHLFWLTAKHWALPPMAQSKFFQMSLHTFTGPQQ
jgi:hypothetical protein